MASDTVYEKTWETKPLGFSIIMDTRGKNAYVSSVQNKALNKGKVTLASQIIEVAGQNVEDKDHSDILNLIISSGTPLTLKFRKSSKESGDSAPPCISFQNAPEKVAHRVNGEWSLEENNKINFRNVWRRNTDGDVLCNLWYWPKSQMSAEVAAKIGGGAGAWLITRAPDLGNKNPETIYGAGIDDPEGTCKYPSMITGTWRVFAGTNFIDCKLEVNQNELQ